jgi:hypothetical protein
MEDNREKIKNTQAKALENRNVIVMQDKKRTRKKLRK